MKKCIGCFEEKGLESFYSDKRYKDGKRTRCKNCCKMQSLNYKSQIRKYRKKYDQDNTDKRRNIMLKYKFGISLLEYNNMLDKQGGVCFICEKREVGKALAVDHNHVTGKVRGLLCDKCNKALGLLGDSSDTAQKAAEYLRINENAKN